MIWNLVDFKCKQSQLKFPRLPIEIKLEIPWLKIAVLAEFNLFMVRAHQNVDVLAVLDLWVPVLIVVADILVFTNVFRPWWSNIWDKNQESRNWNMELGTRTVRTSVVMVFLNWKWIQNFLYWLGIKCKSGCNDKNNRRNTVLNKLALKVERRTDGKPFWIIRVSRRSTVKQTIK